MDQHRKPLGNVIIGSESGEQATVTNSALDVNVVGGEIIIENPTIVVQTDAFGSTPDSMLFVGSEDGTELGTRQVVKINSDAELVVDGSGHTQPISGTVTADQGTSPWVISGAVTGPLTDAELRATPVDVLGPLTDAELRATPVPVSATDLDIRDLSSATDSVAAVQSGTWNINDITGTVSLPTDAATSSNQTNNLQRTQLVNAAGDAVAIKTLGSTPLAADFGLETNSLMYGLTTGGGGGYVPVKVNPSGTMETACNQSGTWNINNITGTVSLPTGASTLAEQVVQSASLASIDGKIDNNSAGSIYVDNEGRVATYSASILNLAGVNLATDIFTITGSNTKTVKIRRVIVQASAGANTTTDVALLKRSAANTGGTSTAPTIVPFDSNDAAATATVLAYTANPAALGALVGVIQNRKMQFNGTNNLPAETLLVEFGDNNTKPVILRGTSQVFAVNMNGITVTGDLYDITIEWTEE